MLPDINRVNRDSIANLLVPVIKVASINCPVALAVSGLFVHSHPEPPQPGLYTPPKGAEVSTTI
jgi:hypothetical protein